MGDFINSEFHEQINSRNFNQRKNIILYNPSKGFEKTKKIINELFTWLKEVWDNYQNKYLPMRPFAKTSSSCKYCPIKKECWSKTSEIGDIQIEAYEVPKI